MAKMSAAEQRLERLIDHELSEIETDLCSEEELKRRVERVKDYNDVLNDMKQRRKDKSGKTLEYLKIFVPFGTGLLTIGASLYGYFLGMDYDRTGTVPGIARDFWARRPKP